MNDRFPLWSRLPLLAEKYFTPLSNAILVCAALLYALLYPHTRTGIYNDDAVYIIAARDFWHAATAHPLLRLKPDYPLPGLPLMLAPLAKLVGSHWTLLEWIPAFVTFFSVPPFTKLARKWLSPGETLAVVALYALNPVVARLSSIVMPAPFYTLAVVLSFAILSDLLERPTTIKAIALGTILGWGSLVRPEGIVLLISVVMALALTPRTRKLLWGMAVPLAAWFVFTLAWLHSRQPATSEFGHDVSALISYWPNNLGSAIQFSAKLFEVFITGTWTTLRFLPHSLAFYTSATIMAVWIIGIGVGFRNLWLKSNDRTTLLAAAFFSGSFFLIHVFWHVASSFYFLPLFPLALLFFVRGANTCLANVKNGATWTRIALVCLFLSYGYENVRRVYRTYWVYRPWSAPPWKALKWLQQNLEPSSKILSNIAATVDLYTTHSAVGADTTATNVELFLYYSAKQDMPYIVIRDQEILTPGVGTTEDPNLIVARYLRWIRLYPQRFVCVFDDASEKTKIYQMTSPPEFVNAFDLFIEAVQEFEVRRYGQSLDSVKRSLAMYPTLGGAWNLLGILYLMRGDKKNSEFSFLRATSLLPDSYNDLLNLATLHRRQGEVEVSEDFLKKGLDVAEMRGERKDYEETVKKLRSLWDQGKATLFIDMPMVEKQNLATE